MWPILYWPEISISIAWSHRPGDCSHQEAHEGHFSWLEVHPGTAPWRTSSLPTLTKRISSTIHLTSSSTHHLEYYVFLLALILPVPSHPKGNHFTLSLHTLKIHPQSVKNWKKAYNYPKKSDYKFILHSLSCIIIWFGKFFIHFHCIFHKQLFWTLPSFFRSPKHPSVPPRDYFISK